MLRATITMSFTITEQPWGTVDGNDITLYRVAHEGGITAGIINYGAVIQSILTKDRDGRMADVVLGYDDLQGYLEDPFFMGCVVGRFANRIAGGKAAIEGVAYQLSLKNGNTFHHHGGIAGFNQKVWRAHPFKNTHEAGVIMQYDSKNGEEGYPGNLLTTVIYTVNDQDELVIDYHAETDQPTIVNLTGHSYFNLSGDHAGSIEQHRLIMPLKRYLPVTGQYIPTGEISGVGGTSLDFTTERPVNEGSFNYTEGYDNTWVVDDWDAVNLKPVALLSDPGTGRTLEVTTTEPSVHVYSGNYLSDEVTGKGGKAHRHHGGICFETQHYPDSPNHPHFPSTMVYPGQPYKSRTVYAFDVRDGR